MADAKEQWRVRIWAKTCGFGPSSFPCPNRRVNVIRFLRSFLHNANQITQVWNRGCTFIVGSCAIHWKWVNRVWHGRASFYHNELWYAHIALNRRINVASGRQLLSHRSRPDASGCCSEEHFWVWILVRCYPVDQCDRVYQYICRDGIHFICTRFVWGAALLLGKADQDSNCKVEDHSLVVDFQMIWNFLSFTYRDWLWGEFHICEALIWIHWFFNSFGPLIFSVDCLV